MRHRDWLKLDETRHRMRWKWHEFFKSYDLLLCPVIGKAAFPHDHCPSFQRMVDIDGKKMPFLNLLFRAGHTGVTCLPASSAPIGFTEDGLPVGVQIVGPQYGDRTACTSPASWRKSTRRSSHRPATSNAAGRSICPAIGPQTMRQKPRSSPIIQAGSRRSVP